VSAAPVEPREGGRPDGSWTVLELLRWTTRHFEGRGIETPRLDAECLLAHALGSDRLRLYVEFEKPVEASERARFRELVRRRADARVPVAQLTGRREFWSLPLQVTPDVLVPRPETETLVEAALALLPDREAAWRILDLGTGSGAVALALATERPAARITATDLSGAALAVAARNVEVLGHGDRVRLLEGDLFAPLAGEEFDLVVSNPPYLAESGADGLAPELRHEPRSALFAGRDGLDVLRRIAAQVRERLAPGGAVAVEVDPSQAQAVRECFHEAGLVETALHRDLAGRPRVVAARRPGPARSSDSGGGA
jgi:release factor glutamine methyltransferase